MYNCHDDIIAYHNSKVTLPEAERTEMRDRRNTNRQRLKDGLKRDGEPVPIGCHSQGSYAMRTMVQHPAKDYDIDDGVYFRKEDLKGPRGGDRSPADVKEIVRKALHDDKFTQPPEVRTNCVRVYYNAGYHVDIPVYRKVTEKNIVGQEETWYELASTEWKRSDPLGVTNWFKDENQRQSPDSNNGGQLRRITRYQKAFAGSRESWRPRIASGFMITKLVTERYRPNAAREDQALYDTMMAIHDQLKWDLEIRHPTVPGENLTKGPDDAQSRFLKDKLDWAIDELDVLFDPRCTREQALKSWDKVFSTDFFINRLSVEDSKEKSASQGAGLGTAAAVGVVGSGLAAAILSGRNSAEARAPDKPVDKRGGGRYA